MNRGFWNGEPEAVREFTGKRLNLDYETWGKGGLYARREAGEREKTASATC